MDAVFPFVDPFVGDEVGVRPAPDLITARKLIVDVEQIGDFRVGKLPEEVCVSVTRKRAAALA